MISSSAIALATTLVLPLPPSHTKNWLEVDPSDSGSHRRQSSIRTTEKFSAGISLTTSANVVAHSLDNLSVPLTNTLAQLDLYSTLSPGWDGEGSQPPSGESIKFAKKLLDIIPSGVSVPYPMISKEGTIGFYWSNEFAFADIEIDDSHSFSIFAQKRTGQPVEHFFENVPLDEKTHLILAECLGSLGRI